MARTIDDAFGGKATTLEEKRAIWAESVHPDAIWEGPMFEQPVSFVGFQATTRFFEFLLSTVEEFSVEAVGTYPTSDPDTVIVESHGGGPTVTGGRYTQRYFSIITVKDGKTFRMREYCNPFQTYQAFGRERWERETRAIMDQFNVPWPDSQPRDPISLPPI